MQWQSQKQGSVALQRACPKCGLPLLTADRFCQGCGAFCPAESGEDPYVGRCLGNRFVVEQLLDEGGMGRVYRGRDRFSGNTVAIKVLKASLLAREDIRRRFVIEGQCLFNVVHPRIVRFLAFWEDPSGEPFLVMEYLRGETLGSYQFRQPKQRLNVAKAVDITCEALEGLYHLHSLPRPLVHRDIKPENIWMLEDGHVKLMDLGIARSWEGDALEGDRRAILGTVEYMSPEQTRHGEVSTASDQYSMAVTLYEMCCGVVPFPRSKEDQRGRQVMDMHRKAKPPDPRTVTPELPEYVSRAILRALAKKPEDRFASAFHFRRFLTSRGGSGW